jgi:Fe-S-cluster containining protein
MQEQVLSRATVLHEAIRESADNSKQPTLFDEDDARIDRIVDAARVPPCPCLGNAGECLIYEHRPMACRLEGVPMIDVNDGLFGDWCDLNFKEGLSETAKADLKQDYNHIGEIQETRSAAAAHRAGISDCSTVTFIPSVIAEYENFWKRLLT